MFTLLCPLFFVFTLKWASLPVSQLALGNDFAPVLATLPLDISNVTPQRGRIFVAIYDRADGYMDESKARYKQAFMVGPTNTLHLDLPDLGAGTYAISCYQDLNNNGRLDKNLVGIPTEPYGFSAGARPKLRAPYWSEAKVNFNGKNPINVRLDTW
jgi:uncharacterized protein (DUF2141 family)